MESFARGGLRAGEHLGSKLSYDAAHKRVCIVVTDTIPDIVHHGAFVQRTLFEQKDSKWEFVPVKQWEERKFPAPSRHQAGRTVPDWIRRR